MLLMEDNQNDAVRLAMKRHGLILSESDSDSDGFEDFDQIHEQNKPPPIDAEYIRNNLVVILPKVIENVWTKQMENNPENEDVTVVDASAFPPLSYGFRTRKLENRNLLLSTSDVKKSNEKCDNEINNWPGPYSNGDINEKIEKKELNEFFDEVYTFESTEERLELRDISKNQLIGSRSHLKETTPDSTHLADSSTESETKNMHKFSEEPHLVGNVQKSKKNNKKKKSNHTLSLNQTDLVKNYVKKREISNYTKKNIKAINPLVEAIEKSEKILTHTSSSDNDVNKRSSSNFTYREKDLNDQTPSSGTHHEEKCTKVSKKSKKGGSTPILPLNKKDRIRNDDKKSPINITKKENDLKDQDSSCRIHIEEKSNRNLITCICESDVDLEDPCNLFYIQVEISPKKHKNKIVNEYFETPSLAFTNERTEAEYFSGTTFKNKSKTMKTNVPYVSQECQQGIESYSFPNEQFYQIPIASDVIVSSTSQTPRVIENVWMKRMKNNPKIASVTVDNNAFPPLNHINSESCDKHIRTLHSNKDHNEPNLEHEKNIEKDENGSDDDFYTFDLTGKGIEHLASSHTEIETKGDHKFYEESNRTLSNCVENAQKLSNSELSCIVQGKRKNKKKKKSNPGLDKKYTVENDESSGNLTKREEDLKGENCSRGILYEENSSRETEKNNQKLTSTFSFVEGTKKKSNPIVPSKKKDILENDVKKGSLSNLTRREKDLKDSSERISLEEKDIGSLTDFSLIAFKNIPKKHRNKKISVALLSKEENIGINKVHGSVLRLASNSETTVDEYSGTTIKNTFLHEPSIDKSTQVKCRGALSYLSIPKIYNNQETNIYMEQTNNWTHIYYDNYEKHVKHYGLCKEKTKEIRDFSKTSYGIEDCMFRHFHLIVNPSRKNNEINSTLCKQIMQTDMQLDFYLRIQLY
ncbi:hypothetical protein JTB14_035523 [Gonioctena quinquepunctata]|nr:hypothetical protein JTB14_035523 [Gonioctena quinquepunctata]